MKDKTIAIISHPHYLEHDTGGKDHPEAPERIPVINERLAHGSLGGQVRFWEPGPAPREWLLSFHSENWLFRFEEEVLSGRTYINHPDNQVGFDSYRVALLSAGAGLKGIDLIENDGQRIVFCSTRPPGHHAESSMPYGFCYLNNCVIATRYWQRKYSRRRVCVLDFDAHHGNGIQSAFEEEADTLYISIHEHPSFSYPGTGLEEEDGIGDGGGTICNICLLPGTGDAQMLKRLDSLVAYRLAAFEPEALIVAAGFDGHRLDDMSGLRYSTELYRELGERIGAWAGRYCQRRLLSILEGGYYLPVLGESVESYLAGLASTLADDV